MTSDNRFDDVYTAEFARRQALQIASGMVYVVRQGQVHLDLKPENILEFNSGSDDKPNWVPKVRCFLRDRHS